MYKILNSKQLMRKQRKTLGGYFILQHPVDYNKLRCLLLFKPLHCDTVVNYLQ